MLTVIFVRSHKFRALFPDNLPSDFMRDPAGDLGTKQFKMAERLASQTLQKFAELEELAQEIMEDKQQV